MSTLQPSEKIIVTVFLVRCEADLVVQIRSTGGHGERLELRAVQAKNVDDIVSDAAGRSSGTAGHGDVGELLFEEIELFEAWAEVMAPFGDTVGFVDGDPGKLFLLVDGAEVSSKVIQHAELGGDIEQTCVRMATLEVVEDGGLGGVGSGAVDCGDVDASGA